MTVRRRRDPEEIRISEITRIEMVEKDMTARERILAKIKIGKPKAEPRPEVKNYGYPGDKVENFKKKLTGFCGEYMEFDSRKVALEWLETHIDLENEKVYSNVVDFPAPYSYEDFMDPREAHILDKAIVDSDLGVGEMGAVWLSLENLGVAGAALLCRDLYVLLSREDIVGGILDAYDKINPAAPK